MNRIFSFCMAASLILFSCSKEDDTNEYVPSGNGDNNNDPNVPVIEGGTAFLQFDDSSETTWYAHSLTRNVNNNTMTLSATGENNTKFELQTVDLLSDSKVPVGNSVGYLKFTNEEGEEFSTDISGAGNVFYDRYDKERVEATFLFPLVGSIKNNFMELNNGKFAFNMPFNVSVGMDAIDPDTWDSYMFVEIPVLSSGGSVQYTSGPKSGYEIEISSTDDVVDPGSIQFSGSAGDAYSYKIDFSEINKKKDITVDVQLTYNDSLIQTVSQSVNVLPIFGTYRLQAMNGAPATSATLSIEAITSPSNHFYKATSAFFGKTILFEDDGTGDVECYDTFPYRGETCTNIYFYDNGPNEIHMAVHSATFHDFYVLIRQ